MTAIEVDELVVRYDDVVAVDGASLRVDPGEVLGLMGDNGAGKSTLVKIIAGNFPPTSGDIVLQDRTVHFHKPVEARQNVAGRGPVDANDRQRAPPQRRRRRDDRVVGTH